MLSLKFQTLPSLPLSHSTSPRKSSLTTLLENSTTTDSPRVKIGNSHSSSCQSSPCWTHSLRRLWTTPSVPSWHFVFTDPDSISACGESRFWFNLQLLLETKKKRSLELQSLCVVLCTWRLILAFLVSRCHYPALFKSKSVSY